MFLYHNIRSYRFSFRLLYFFFLFTFFLLLSRVLLFILKSTYMLHPISIHLHIYIKNSIYLDKSRFFRRSCDNASMHNTTNRLSHEYLSWSNNLLPSKLLAKPTLSLAAECQASQYVSIARSPVELEPCHTIFCGLKIYII